MSQVASHGNVVGKLQDGLLMIVGDNQLGPDFLSLGVLINMVGVIACQLELGPLCSPQGISHGSVDLAYLFVGPAQCGLIPLVATKICKGGSSWDSPQGGPASSLGLGAHQGVPLGVLQPPPLLPKKAVKPQPVSSQDDRIDEVEANPSVNTHISLLMVREI